MKRLYKIIILCFYIACSSKVQIVENFSNRGWLSDDAFLVRAVGCAKYKTNESTTRKAQALHAALIMAKFIALEEFTTTIARDVTRIPRREILNKITIEFGSPINEGKVVELYYDDDDNCTIAYLINSPNIKQRLFALRNRLLVLQ